MLLVCLLVNKQITKLPNFSFVKLWTSFILVSASLSFIFFIINAFVNYCLCLQERGGSLLKEEAVDEMGNYGEHMAGGWRRNEGGYGVGGNNNWRGGGGGEPWGGRGAGGGGGRGAAGQHWGEHKCN